MASQNKTIWLTETIDAPWLKQVFRFLIIGMLNTALDFCLYYLLTRWFAIFAMWKTGAKSISYAVGILNSFYWNKTWTFQSHGDLWTNLLPFILTNLAGLVINALIMQLCLTTLRLPEFLSLGLATGGSLFWNFSISKWLIFNEN